MSMNDYERCMSDLEQNAALRDELNALEADPGAWACWAGTKGYTLTREEAMGLAEYVDREISDDDLEKVAGGWCGNELTTG